MSRFFPIPLAQSATNESSFESTETEAATNPQADIYYDFPGPPPNLLRIQPERRSRSARGNHFMTDDNSQDRFSDAEINPLQGPPSPPMEFPPSPAPECFMRQEFYPEPKVTARRLSLSRNPLGYYPYTIPSIICRNFQPGVHIRRFDIMQCIDRTQFEGGRKRFLGELSNWKGHGPSKLRFCTTAAKLEEAGDEDFDYETLEFLHCEDAYDYDSEGTVVVSTWNTISSELKEAGEWEDDPALLPHSMDINDEARLF